MEDKEQKIKISFETNADQVGGKVDGLTDKLQGTTKATEGVEGAQKKAAKSTKDLGGSVEDLGGPIGGAISGFKAMLKQLWLLVANPIVATFVAIVGALTLVFKAFTSTNEGADKLEQVIAGLGATIDVLRDRFLKLISLDFKGAFSGVGDEIAKEFKQAAKLAEVLQEVEDASRSLSVSRAKLNRDLAASKELITDENASYADKKKAINDVRKAEGEQTVQELANAKRKFDAIKAQNALSDTSDQDLKKQADAESALFNLQAEQSANKRAFNRLDKKADNEEKARLKELTNGRTEAQTKKDAADKLAEDKRLALIKEGVDAETAIRKTNEDLQDKTEEQKLARQKERAFQEIEVLKKKGIETSELTKLNIIKFAALETELKVKTEEEERKRKADSLFKDLELIISNKDAENQVRIDAINQEQALIQSLYDAKLLKEEEFNSRQSVLSAARTEIAQKEAADIIAVETAKEKLKEELQAKAGATASQGVALIAQIFGKNKKVQKAAMIAEGAISIGKQIASNNVANAGALAAPSNILLPGSAIPVIALNNIATGIGVASTIASTATALKSLGGGGGSLSGGARPNGSGGSATSSTPQVSFQASSENQISSNIARNTKDQPPIKAFVVGKDITTQQSLDNNRIKSNSI